MENASNFFNGVKFFLSQNGYLSAESLKNFKILSDSLKDYDQYQNLINLLDQTSSKKLIYTPKSLNFFKKNR